MNCLECQALLHERLDGQPSGPSSPPRSPELDRHLAQCTDCRELFAGARLLAQGLQALPRPTPTDGLATRIVAAALRDREVRRQRVRLRVYATAALAASVLALLFSGYLLPTSGKKEDATIVKKDAPPAEAPRLAARADDARQAVAQLTERVADQTREQAKVLLAMGNPLELAQIAAWPVFNELEEPLDPAARSLREQAQTVAEPMARTARGAWNYFIKELPIFDVNPSN